jgi:hypothetical protein
LLNHSPYGEFLIPQSGINLATLQSCMPDPVAMFVLWPLKIKMLES